MSIATAPAISLNQVSLRFQEKILFENLSLELESAKITCLLGPSGVGKTTLLRLLAALPLFGRGQNQLSSLPRRVVKFTQQQTLINYQEKNSYCQGYIHASDDLALPGRITYMAQSDLLLPWLSVRDNILLGSYLRGETRPPALIEKAQHLLQSVGLSAEINAKPATLSAGMKQRAALARTLMEDKPIVLMDEPFSALDAITRYEMQTLTTEKLRGKTVLLITHDPWEALRMADKILVLRGQPAQLSPPIIPPETTPRDLTHSALLPLQKQLMAELHMQVAR